MGLAIIEPGLLATIQDLGRNGYRAWGVPVGGAFDRESAALSNALLGNSLDSAGIELTLSGGVFKATSPLGLALAGAPLAAKVIDRDGLETLLRMPLSFSMKEGDRLFLDRMTLGARAYLAVLGGWRSPVVLGSRSEERPLRRGDQVPCEAGWIPRRHPDPADVCFSTADSAPIRVLDGPDTDRCGLISFAADAVYRVTSRSDRMGLRLAGPAWEGRTEPDRRSMPVAPGALQVAGDQLLLLGVSCGTMGGYPHVAHVISADLDRIGQARPGETLRFTRVSLEEARQLDRQQRADRVERLSRIAIAASDRLPGMASEPRD
ncbi:MAG: biotin-dependent carboxyltransferase family protein [Isosphaeraceae bacterium]